MSKIAQAEACLPPAGGRYGIAHIAIPENRWLLKATGLSLGDIFFEVIVLHNEPDMHYHECCCLLSIYCYKK